MRFDLLCEMILESKDKLKKTLYANIDGHAIFSVFGPEVRKMSKEMYDFADYATFVSFNDFPKNEIWINSELSGRERDIAISDALHEIRSYQQSRSKSKAIDSVLTNDRTIRSISDKNIIFKDLYLKEYKSSKVKLQDKDVKVYIVNGEKARIIWAELKYSNPFIQGGHHFVYAIIPENEIWIDDTIDPSEYDRVLVHESTERHKMKFEKWPYEKAHKYAETQEAKFLKERQYE